MIVIFQFLYDQSVYVSALTYSIFCICMGNFNASTWPVLIELSLPFDTKSICGWYLSLFFFWCMDVSYLTCFLWGTTQFIGCCLYLEAACEHFDFQMQTFQQNIEKNPHENLRQQYHQPNGKIKDAIEIHNLVYE